MGNEKPHPEDLYDAWHRVNTDNVRLMKEADRLRNDKIGATNESIRLAREIESLREYASHNESCKITIWHYDNSARRNARLTESTTCPPCTCGLDDLLKEPDDG